MQNENQNTLRVFLFWNLVWFGMQIIFLYHTYNHPSNYNDHIFKKILNIPLSQYIQEKFPAMPWNPGYIIIYHSM